MSADLAAIKDLQGKSISWDRALTVMTENNIALARSWDGVIGAEERVRQLYLDLIPGASISGNVTKALTQVANLTQDDFAVSVFSFINFPGLIAFRVRYYGATLELIRARWAYELKLRELTIQLNERFLQYALLLERRNNLAISARFEPPPNVLNGLDTTPEALIKEEAQIALANEARTMQASLARILGSSSNRWQPRVETLPQWDYVKRPLPLDDPKKFGTLFRQLQALQLEGQRLSKLGVKLQYWPDLNFSLSVPTLYNSNGQRFDTDQVFLSLNTSVPLDTDLSIWFQLNRLKRQIALDRQELTEENSILMEQLMANQRALRLNNKQRRLNEIRLKAISREERSLDLQKMRQQLEKSLVLTENRSTLLLESAQLEGSLWLFDERRWKRLRWKEAEKKK